MTEWFRWRWPGDVTEGGGAADDPALGRDRLRARVRGRARSARERGRPQKVLVPRSRSRPRSTRSRLSPSRRKSSTRPDFGWVARSYDALRPADANWWEVFELLVREGRPRRRRRARRHRLRHGPGRGGAGRARVARLGRRSRSRRWPRSHARAREHGQGRARRAAAVQGRLVRAGADVARRAPRRPSPAFGEAGARARGRTGASRSAPSIRSTSSATG